MERFSARVIPDDFMRFSSKVERCVGSDFVPSTDWFFFFYNKERYEYEYEYKFYDGVVKPVPLGDALIRVLGDISHRFLANAQEVREDERLRRFVDGRRRGVVCGERELREVAANREKR